MKLKVYGVNYDGKERLVVAASSQKLAAQLMGVTIGCMRDFGSVTGNKEEIAKAMIEPGRVWRRGYMIGDQLEPVGVVPCQP